MKIDHPTSLPRYLKKYMQEALKAIDQKLVKDIEFSGPTYQVLVEDPHSREEFWAFVQLNRENDIQDAFCSCDNLQDSGCLHLATAYLSLFDEHNEALHQRFSRSFWFHFLRLFEERLGSDSHVLEKFAEGHYERRSRLGKTIFRVSGKELRSVEIIEEIINKREIETEETSLKFSSLTEEEIIFWKKGIPHPQLRFDLSFWSDLAKWLLKKQEDGQAYDFNLRYSKKELPCWFEVIFNDVEVGFYISEANLAPLIHSLQTIRSPLTISNVDHQKIGQIHYDKNEQVLHIEACPAFERLKTEGQKEIDYEKAIRVGEWMFIPGDGFYMEESHELLKSPILHGEEIVQALTDHHKMISSLILNSIVYQEVVQLSYRLSFDRERNLHLSAYLFEPGDLEKESSWLIGNWAYIDDDGFYPVEGNRFEGIETFIPYAHVSDFVTQNRSWFDTQEGFNTHVRSIEYQLGYQVSSAKRLTFHKSLHSLEAGAQQEDFGAWVYLKDYGFYSKTAGPFNYLLNSRISLSPEQVPLFINLNQDELGLIPNFFADRCPVKKVGLNFVLVEKSKVEVTPHYHLIEEHEGKVPILFDNYIYLEGIGFYELPHHLRLPEKFHSKTVLEGEELILFLSYEFENLQKIAFSVDPRLIRPTRCQLVTDSIELFTEKGRGWYRFQLFYQTEQGLIPLFAIRQALTKKFPFAFFDAGMLDLREKKFDWLRLLSKDRFEKGRDTIILSTLDFMRLNALDGIELLEVDSSEKQKSVKLIFEELTELHPSHLPDMGGLMSHLRPYQEIGVHWLWFLYSHQLSGLLCDDMGLGKTHQAMALLAGVANLFESYAEGGRCHFLIVCPTSVIYHWQEKLENFLPKLRVCSFYGANRTLEGFRGDFDVLLTSYGVLRNEMEELSKFPFEVAIFDEIQIAKNQFSRVFSALKQIKGQMKLGLTGTPIENHLRELKSLFDIVLPTYMPGEQEYRDFFIKPIEKEHNPQRKTLLNRLINPFVLRRKKSEVLQDLPEKTEEISYCDLMPYQAQLYSEVLLRKQHHLLEELRDERSNIPYLHIFALLSSLKQICNHPASYLKRPLDYQEFQSGKWELFLELLREARESRQKVVVFSQYLGMLDIIEAHLRNHGIGFASLRGSTQNRKEQLKFFSESAECEVFVGSLHAAGLGIDLTAASVVLHYDRWWNAAREDQATDRVHRMGQTKGVQVFKLVTKGTFEEKIDAMIARKGRLMEDIIGVDDQNALKKFSREELVELLEFKKSDHEFIPDDLK